MMPGGREAQQLNVLTALPEDPGSLLALTFYTLLLCMGSGAIPHIWRSEEL